MFLRILLCSAVVTLMAACATPGKNSFNYAPPEFVTVKNEITVNKPFEQVWDELVRELARGFFVVNNIEKASRLINVSFSTSNPEDFIDCGMTTRGFTQGKKSETVKYNVAESAKYKLGNGVDQSGVFALIFYLDRKTSLDGRMNIYVAPNGDAADVTVNARYVLDINVTGIHAEVHQNGTIMRSVPANPENSKVSFNTNQPNKDDDGMSCVSRGILEKQVLDMVAT